MAKRAQMPKSPPPKSATSRGRAQRKVSPVILLLVVVAAVFLLIIGIVLLQNQAARKPIEVSGVVGEGTSWGPQNAKVSVVTYSDFGCSHCRNFALGAGKQLRAEYESTGKVRFEYKHFIINPPDTRNAANAAECAADQGRFWDYHDLLFSQQGVSQSPFAKPALKQYATQLGLNAKQFDDCVDRDTHVDKVVRDSAEGTNAGVTGTPTFFINGKEIVGELPYAQLKSDVEAALAAQQ
jgi:protein-disulfide isomerase